jgi:hypothetical protein
MVTDRRGSTVIFDADTDSAIGSVRTPSGDFDSAGNCAITANQQLAFVSAPRAGVYVIDLTTSPPGLAPGVNPIPVSNYGLDLSMTADEEFLIVGGSSQSALVSVIHIASRSEVATFPVRGPVAVEACGVDSVLIVSRSQSTNSIHRFTIDAAGTLTDTGVSLVLGAPDPHPLEGGNNVTCAPDGSSGVAILRSGGRTLSFTLPDLQTRTTGDLLGVIFGLSNVFDATGTRLFGLYNVFGGGWFVLQFAFDPGLGTFDPVFSAGFNVVGSRGTSFGLEQFAIHPSGGKLYIPELNADLVAVFTPAGDFLTSIMHPDIDLPTAICVSKPSGTLEVAVTIKPGADPNSANATSRGVIPVAILGSDTFDVADVDATTLAFGPAAAPLAHRNRPHPNDPNHDDIPDLLAHFLTEEAGVAPGDEEACVTGETLDGTPFEGCDSVRTVPPE